MDYQILKSEFSAQKINAYSKLLSAVFPQTDKFTFEFLNWQYGQNPMGTVCGMDAFYNDTLVAHYVTIPVVYNIRGKITKGLLSLNTATHPDHQGKGLFTKLANKTYEEGWKAGYEFVIGVANQNSTPGFLKKLGFSLISPLEAKIGCGKVIIDRSFNYQARSVWSNEALQWRVSNPVITYFKNGNNIVASTGEFGILAQLQNPEKSSSNSIQLKARNSFLKLWIGIAQAKSRQGIFVELPQKLRSSPLNLIFKDLSGNIPAITKKEILFELIDFDAY